MKAAMPPQIMTPNHGLAGAVKIEIEKDKQNKKLKKNKKKFNNDVS